MRKKMLDENTKKLAIGILSGTSVDGIDVALLKISGSDINTKIKLVDFYTFPYSKSVRNAIMTNSIAATASVDKICKLNIILGKLYAEAALEICKKNRISSSKISFIGSHGQTIHHLPENRVYAGINMKSTLQIGDPSVIANLTGITTVGDFRVADCSVGGGGAPLVPYFDYILFQSKKYNRGLLNIGGISNITVIPKNSTKDDVVAFDTGPGNMLIDGFMKVLFKKDIDTNGKYASKGTMNDDVLNFLSKDNFYKKKPPKSTGREHYGFKFQKSVLKSFNHKNKYDLLRTITEFTAIAINYNYQKFILPTTKIDELIVSGGGAKNFVLMKSLKNYFKDVKIKTFNSFGLTVDSKESALFAVLANECLLGKPANMPSVTGSKKDVILGKICLPY
jgi:anhydro-N-acetylmuramic acid kinase